MPVYSWDFRSTEALTFSFSHRILSSGSGVQELVMVRGKCMEIAICWFEISPVNTVRNVKARTSLEKAVLVLEGGFHAASVCESLN